MEGLRYHNLAVFVLTSEFFKMEQGLGGDQELIEEAIQYLWQDFTGYGMYRDPDDPMTYDLVVKQQLDMVRVLGYSGAHWEWITEICRRGAAGMTSVCWRASHIGKLTYRTRVGTVLDGMNALRISLTPFGLIMKRIDPLRVAIDEAHKRGLKLFVYYTLFDEAYTDPHTGIVSECEIGRRHPEYYLVHRDGGSFVRGVFSFGYPEVRAYFAALVEEALEYDPDGIYLDCARTHAGANPIPVHGWWPQWTNPYLAYGYNEPDVAWYREKYGEHPPGPTYTDTGPLEPTEAERNWNRVRGEGLTLFLREMRPIMVQAAGKPLHICFFPSTFALMGQMTEKMLRSSADGVFFYEHCGNDHRTWETVAAAKRAAIRE